MPHLHVKQCRVPLLPHKADKFTFTFAAQNISNTDEKLIAVQSNKENFFLLCYSKQEKHLLKSDKLTRPTSTYALHLAMMKYADIANLEIIASNIPQKEENEHLKDSSVLKNISFFTAPFTTDKKIVIEIGFGSGRHLLHRAKQYPNKLFIGIEIHKASIQQVIKAINIEHLNNIYLLDYDARLFLELLPSNSIEKIYIHFPVPWDKKPQRRVISPSFIDEAYRVLEKNAALELRTDSQNYYEYSYQCFINRHKVLLNIKKNQRIDITSKYEARWQKMQKDIYDIVMIKDDISSRSEINGTFDFNAPLIHKTDPSSFLNKQTVKFGEGFVHIERVYRIIDTNSYMLRVSMGSFSRPEHLYVIIHSDTIEYFPKQPIKSIINLKAHKILNGLIYE